MVGCLVLFLLVLKLPGLDLPFHQGEWKAARFAVEGATVVEPYFHGSPLAEFLFSAAGATLQPDYFRLLPLFLTVLSYVLLYVIVAARAGARAALLSLFLFGTVAYGALGATMFDLDGAILPFFFLLAVFAYDRMARGGRSRIPFALLLILSIGALFSLVVPRTSALVFDVSRDWGQIAVQTGRVLLYVGPLLYALAFVTGDVFDRTRVFFAYLTFAFLFYFVLFDFSTGGLDKCLLLIVAPLCAIIGVTLATQISRISDLRPAYCAALLLGGIGLLALNFLPQEALSLYPKSAWVKEILGLHWNILIPFVGGSGPAGFYVSFLFIAASFLVAGGITLFALIRPQWRRQLVTALLFLSILYAGIFTEELYFGKINGSTRDVLNDSIEYIRQSDKVTSVITHGATGAFELWQMGKFAERFYAVPQYEERYKELFSTFRGHYLVVDIPRWDQHSFYEDFFSHCASTFTSASGVIRGHVYECPVVLKKP